jgi:AMMECR1 domain-containing protein
LLPHLEGVDTVAEQVHIAKQKAGILSEEEVEMWRFEVERYYE